MSRRRSVFLVVALLGCVVSAAWAALEGLRWLELRTAVAGEKRTVAQARLRIQQLESTGVAARPLGETRSPATAAVRAVELGSSPVVVSDWLSTIQRLCDASGVTIESRRAPKSTQSSRQTYVVRGAATPSQLCAFLTRVESHPQLLVVHGLGIEARPDGRPGIEVLLASYHADEEER